MVRSAGVSNAAPRTQADLLQLFEPVRADLAAVEIEFARQVESQVHVIPEIGNYLLHSGGKRVRPAVLLMAARLCGYSGPRAILNAAVVEFIHTATLVHDDIIDDSDVRRGRKAVHSQWGNDVTVLAGDFLYIKSMAMALTQDSLEVVRLLCDVTLRMIEGELYQLTKNGVVDLSEDEHFEIIRRKTAHLFAGCAEIGGMLGEVSQEKRQALREYGFSLGIMFQLVDDLLDFTGAAEALGKPVGGDLREGKITLPIIHLLEHGGPEADRLIRDAVRDRHVSTDAWARLSALLAEHRSIDYAYGRAVEFGENAKRQLRLFSPGPEREALTALADYVLLRDR
jgi:octaprenyl-diphosphate synthase